MATYGFSSEDAKRIGAVVRQVEGDRTGRRSGASGGSGATPGVRLLLAKHESTAGWPKGATAVVTIHAGDTIAPVETMVARNQFVSFSADTACTQKWVALGNNGFGWYVINSENACPGTCSMEWAGVDFSAFPGFNASAVQLLGHSSTGPCLQWYNVANVDVVTNVTLSTAAIEFQRIRVGVVTTQTAATIALSITTCATAS